MFNEEYFFLKEEHDKLLFLMEGNSKLKGDKEYEYLDIIPKNVSKDTALKFLSNYLKINHNEILAVGDNLNDLSLVKNVGVGVAVENAYPELKQVAKYTTKAPVEKGAFAEAVFKFVKF